MKEYIGIILYIKAFPESCREKSWEKKDIWIYSYLELQELKVFTKTFKDEWKC